MNVTVCDQDVLRGVGIDAVRVGGGGIVEDREVVGQKALDVDGMDLTYGDDGGFRCKGWSRERERERGDR